MNIREELIRALSLLDARKNDRVALENIFELRPSELVQIARKQKDELLKLMRQRIARKQLIGAP